MQNCQSPDLPFRLQSAHEPVASNGATATVAVKLDSSPAKVALVVGVMLPVWCATVRAAVSDEVHCLASLVGAHGARADWDRDYQNTRYGPGWARAVISVASSWLKCRSRTTPSTSPTSALAGVQPSGPCGPRAPRSTAPTGSLGGCSNSSENSVSLVPSSCSSKDRLTLGGSPLDSWLTAVQSNRRLRVWKSLWNRRLAFTQRAVA